MTVSPRKTRKAEHAAVVREARKQYDELAAAQAGVCAICSSPPATRRLYVDHDHKTMKVRGLLCFRCNRALPNYVTVEWLRAAAGYLERAAVENPVEAVDNS